MRVNLKTILLFLTVTAVIITCAVYMRCADHFTFPQHLVGHWDRRLYAVQSGPEVHEGNHNSEGDPSNQILNDDDGDPESNGIQDSAASSSSLQDIDCIINQEYSIRCKLDGSTHEVFVPFTFLRHYFDVLGSLSSSPAGAQMPRGFAMTASYSSSTSSTTAKVIDQMDAIKHHPSMTTPLSNSLKFFWMHSTGKINPPKGKYDARGVFMYFENYNVEMRDRVKCISAAEGVPVSTQWEKRGYFYPTQIAQFALSHYSKNRTETEPRITILENADEIRANWLLEKSSNLTRIWHPKFKTSVVQYETAIDYQSAIRLNYNKTFNNYINRTINSNTNHNNDSINDNKTINNINNVSNQLIQELILDADVLLVTNSSSLMIIMENRETKRTYRLHYIPTELLISVQDDNIYYGMGLRSLNRWHHLTRDLHIDVQKGLLFDGLSKKSGGGGAAASASSASSSSSSTAHAKLKRNDLRLISVSFMGVGFFDNLTLSSSNHLGNFYAGADWLVNNQDNETGGWPNPVRRSLNGFPELKAGWLSAMGQGHAISVLARAHWHSGDADGRYLRAAALALQPFQVLSKHGGVLAMFMDKYPWYEEYPTTPPSFVLNGFIYSLLGLYDLNSIAPVAIARQAGRLYRQGMESLRKMLLLYDTGSGTSYDLRHLSLGVAPNLARWDYHATHVNQLLLLATIHNDTDHLVQRTAARWRGYMLGKRAKHN